MISTLILLHPHPSAINTAVSTAIGLLFGLALMSVLFVGFSVLTLLFVKVMTDKVIRRYWPKFACLPRPQDELIGGAPPANVRKIALDFMMEARRKAEQEITGNFIRRQAIRYGIAHPVNPELEFNLESLRVAVSHQPSPIPPPEKHDLWSLVKFQHGVSYFLISKLTQRGRGTRCGWSPSPQKKLTFDRVTAVRWAQTLGSDVFPIPSNAEARLILRREMKQGQKQNEKSGGGACDSQLNSGEWLLSSL